MSLRAATVRGLVRSPSAGVFRTGQIRKYGYLNGAASTCFSTGDDPKLDLGATFCAEADMALADWTPAGVQDPIGRYAPATNKRSYLMRVQTNGIISFVMSTDGTAGTVTQHDSTVAPTVANGSKLKIRFYKNGTVGQFWSSTDGFTWTQLGNNVVTPAGAPFATDIPLFAGAVEGPTNYVIGRLYGVKLYSDFGTTELVNFNPARYTGGTTFTASTGEVWTLNGAAKILAQEL